MKTKTEALKFGILIHRKLSKKDLVKFKERLTGWKVYNMTVGIHNIATEVSFLVPEIAISKNSLQMTSEIKSYTRSFENNDDYSMLFYDIKQVFKFHFPKLDLFLIPSGTEYFRFTNRRVKMTVQMSDGEDGKVTELKTFVNIN